MSISKMSTGFSIIISELAKETVPPKTKMDYLILALWIMNPNDIDPPEGVMIPKAPRRKSYISKKNKMKQIMQIEHSYCIPNQGRKICSGCNKSCRYKQLIQCYYCTFGYHQSCLNPPTTLPTGSRWMCPNHPQYLIDCVAALAAREQSGQDLPVRPVVKHNVTANQDSGMLLMEVGTAEGCDLRLDAADCHCISRHHAAIYMDEDSSAVRLVNYSKYGSFVYKNGEVTKLGESVYCGPRDRNEPRSPSPVDQTMPVSREDPCCCHQPPVLALTQCSTTLLTGTCLLRFGCQIYAFSLLDTDMPPEA